MKQIYYKENRVIKFLFKILWLFIIITLTIILYDLYTNIDTNPIKDEKISNFEVVEANEKNDSKYEMINEVSKKVVGISKLKNTNINFFNMDAVTTYNLGTGVIVSNKGYLISNYHITGNKYSKCYINTEKGEELEAEVKWVDKDLDLSILKISTFRETENAILGNSDNINVGEKVYAIGNPLGTEFQRTVTCGIISALNRTVKIEEEKKSYMEDLIQTDASINNGNSGGPLINEKRRNYWYYNNKNNRCRRNWICSTNKHYKTNNRII